VSPPTAGMNKPETKSVPMKKKGIFYGTKQVRAECRERERVLMQTKHEFERILSAFV
jgi:hypothetical protein